jgi:hypothetical protein
LGETPAELSLAVLSGALKPVAAGLLPSSRVRWASDALSVP